MWKLNDNFSQIVKVCWKGKNLTPGNFKLFSRFFFSEQTSSELAFSLKAILLIDFEVNYSTNVARGQ